MTITKDNVVPLNNSSWGIQISNKTQGWGTMNLLAL